MKRERAYTYNEFLKLQTDLSYGLEHPLFQHDTWKNAKNVLDYGCGNGAYSLMLSKDYKNKKYQCVDIDENIIHYAKELLSEPVFSVFNGDHNSLIVKSKFDFVILRHLTSYLSNRESFFNWIANNTSKNAAILIIDADDENMIITPELPFFTKGLDDFVEDLKEVGGQRDLREDIINECKAVGFDIQYSNRIIVNSKLPNYKEKLFLYMMLVAELDFGSPVPDKVKEELYSWAIDPDSYVQYGLFGTLMIKDQ